MKLSKTLGVAAATALVTTLAVAIESTPETVKSTPVTGTVAGAITFDGELPKIQPLTISAEASEGCCADGEAVSPTDMSLLIDAKTKGIANVVVALEVEDFEFKVPEEPVLVDQQKCRFTPHVSVVHVGTTMSFKNSDSIPHNVHTYPAKNEPDNQTVGAGKDIKRKYTMAEPVKVACDIHPWMGSWVYVTEGTHFAVTDASGNFSIANVPAGEYKLEIWHEKLGKGKGTAVVKEDGTCEAVNITMGEKKKGRGRGRGR